METTIDRKSAMMGEAGFARQDDDFYPTPAWCGVALKHAMMVPNRIWDPCAGSATLAWLFEATGHTVIKTDLVRRTEGVTGGVDFLAQSRDHYCDAVICNPPYKLARVFVQHAVKLMKPNSGLVAMLLRNEWDSAKTRKDLFAEHPAFRMKVVLLDRPRWAVEMKRLGLHDGSEIASPRHNFAWFVWDWKHQGQPTISWQGK